MSARRWKPMANVTLVTDLSLYTTSHFDPNYSIEPKCLDVHKSRIVCEGTGPSLTVRNISEDALVKEEGDHTVTIN